MKTQIGTRTGNRKTLAATAWGNRHDRGSSVMTPEAEEFFGLVVAFRDRMNPPPVAACYRYAVEVWQRVHGTEAAVPLSLHQVRCWLAIPLPFSAKRKVIERQADALLASARAAVPGATDRSR